MTARVSLPAGVPAPPWPQPNPLFEDTIEGIRDLVLYILGDTGQGIWTNSEIERYLVEGYNSAALSLHLLWDIAYLENQQGVALYKLPDDCYQIERATWSWKLIGPVASTDLERLDARYQYTQGEVYCYIQDKDNLNMLRMVRIPATDADKYTNTGDWGLLRSFTDLTTEVPIQPFGVCRTMPYQHPTGNSYPYGIPRKFVKEEYNTRIEYFRRPRPDIFELPIRFAKYIRAYALWRALERDGDGQNFKLAAYWQKKWTLWMARAAKSMQKLHDNRTGVMGGGVQPRAKPPRPQLPWQYGIVVR